MYSTRTRTAGHLTRPHVILKNECAGAQAPNIVRIIRTNVMLVKLQHKVATVISFELCSRLAGSLVHPVALAEPWGALAERRLASPVVPWLASAVVPRVGAAVQRPASMIELRPAWPAPLSWHLQP